MSTVALWIVVDVIFGVVFVSMELLYSPRFVGFFIGFLAGWANCDRYIIWVTVIVTTFVAEATVVIFCWCDVAHVVIIQSQAIDHVLF